MIKQLRNLLLFTILSPLTLFAQESGKLTGTIIGTKLCVDYNNNNAQSTTVNTASNLFDGNLNNFFATFQRSGGWAGLDLGEEYIITAIGYCPRKDWEQRVVLGLFEGANDPEFMDAVPLFLIDEKPAENTITRKEICCSRGFRYVRYVGPNDVRCNIAELAFYGYKGKGDDSQLIQITNLPTVTIHTKNAEDIIHKEVYIEGIVSVISENGTHIYTGGLNIRGRGNASWGFPKKPYRMKLNDKTSLLGNPAKEKNWTLINNYGDKTLMRNLLAFDLSHRFEMPFTPAGKPVDVILNGEYKGCYQLCDHIQAATGRVEIEKKTGTFIEIDAYANQEPTGEWFTSNSKQIPVTIKHPEDDDLKAKFNDIKAHFNAMESAVYASNFNHPTEGFRRYIDVETFLRHFLVGEISGNTDTYWSTYMYRKNNKEDIYYTGPVWDFDIAFENDNRTYPINSNPNWIYASNGSAATGMRSFVNKLMQDTEFNNRLKSLYAEYRNKGAITAEALVAVIDKYEAEMQASQRLNFMRWPILNSTVHQNFQALGSYDKEVNVVRKYIQQRIEWMDNKLNYITSSVPEAKTLSTITVRADKNGIHIEGTTFPVSIQVYDLNGRKLYTDQTSTHTIIPLPQGTYIVRINESTPNARSVKCSVY